MTADPVRIRSPAAEVPADPRTRSVEVLGAHYKEIAVSAITPNPRQPRRTFDEDALDELAESIRQVGLLQPVVVRAAGPGRYELIMGERRWRASQRAGLTEIGAIVKQTQDDDLLRDALIENLHRQQLDPLEEAAAYQQLLDDFGATHEELAQQDRPLPPAHQQHPPAAEPPAGRAEACRRGRAQRRSRPCPARPGRPATRRSAWPSGSWPRACRSAPSRRSSRSAPTTPRVKRAPGGRQPVAPGLLRLADRLSDLFETRVKVEKGRHKGKIIVEFATLDDLERIVKAMSPESTAGSQDVLPGLGAMGW